MNRPPGAAEIPTPRWNACLFNLPWGRTDNFSASFRAAALSFIEAMSAKGWGISERVFSWGHTSRTRQPATQSTAQQRRLKYICNLNIQPLDGASPQVTLISPLTAVCQAVCGLYTLYTPLRWLAFIAHTEALRILNINEWEMGTQSTHSPKPK